jgi:dihydrodipicolinate synthase/N-acetylneuraminate lyase
MNVRARLLEGGVIPAHPLALTAKRKLDERRQRALTRYYVAAGARGVAVGVHTTQFAIRDCGLYRPVLEISADAPVVRVAGVFSVKEAEWAAALGYHAGLLSFRGLPADASETELLDLARAVAEVTPVFGFYLQPAVGGRILPYAFWREFAEIPNVVAIKIAPFNRYQTLDVMRAVRGAGREGEIALYTGNDDHILGDLLAPGIVGGLLGHWAVWTKCAVEQCRMARDPDLDIRDFLLLGEEVTDCNAALFDVANNFHGCIAGLHEILVRQGLMAGRWCLDPNEDLSPGQMEEIDRICFAYPHLSDDDFVKEHLDEWLR